MVLDDNLLPENFSTICFAHPYSNGIWNGNKPTHFIIPLLLLQITLVVTFTRLCRHLLRPLNQPQIISEILGGMIIGPTFLGTNKTFAENVIPEDSFYVLKHIQVLGMVYFMFIIGVKIDTSLVFKMGRKEVIISLCGIILPVIVVLFISSCVRGFFPETTNYRGMIFALSICVSLTNFPVLHPILSEINLLNSDLGRLSMSLSMMNDVATWIAIVSSSFFFHIGEGHMPVFNLISVIMMSIFIFFVFRPAMLWIIRKTPEGRPVEQKYIVAIILGVMVMSSISELIGETVIIGPLFMGLAIPDGPPLGSTIVQKTETLTRDLLMPTFYAMVGVVTSASEVENFLSWVTLHFIIIAGYIGKFVGTVVPCLMFKMPFEKAVAVGIIMNFKGQFELMHLFNMKRLKFLETWSVSIMICSTLMVTAVATPLVRILHRTIKASERKTRRTIQHAKPNTELCILTCTHNERNVPSIISVLQACYPTKENPICVYVLHLIELVGRATPMLVAHDKHNRPRNPNSTDHIVNAFKIYEEQNTGQVSILPFVSVSPYITMHEDICEFASYKNVSLIIIPYHKQVTYDGEFGAVDNAHQTVNPNILAEAPCSVGVLVHRGTKSTTGALPDQFLKHVGVIFLGGADDREALSYAARMAKHPGINLTIIRILPLDDERDNHMEREEDDELLRDFRCRNMASDHIFYKEEIVKDVEALFSAIRAMDGNFNLFIVGRKHETSSLLTQDVMEWSDDPQLGVIGDMLATVEFKATTSVLVMQQLTKERKDTEVLK